MIGRMMVASRPEACTLADEPSAKVRLVKKILGDDIFGLWHVTDYY